MTPPKPPNKLQSLYDRANKVWIKISFLILIASSLIGWLTDASGWWDSYQEERKLKAQLLADYKLFSEHLPDDHKQAFLEMPSKVKWIEFRQEQAMNQVFYYLMVYDPYYDEHGCKYHTRRFPDDETPESISKRDYWIMIEENGKQTIYLLEATKKACYYTHYEKGYVELPHKWDKRDEE